MHRAAVRRSSTPLMIKGMLPIATLAAYLLGPEDHGANEEMSPAVTIAIWDRTR